jgi:hypothetical protein
MQIMKSSRVLVATLVVAGVTASSALASGGPIDRRSPDAKDAAAALAAAKTVDRRSPDVQDMASRPDTAGNPRIKDLRTTASLAGPPRPVDVTPGPPQFPTNTVPLAPPVEPVAAPPAGDGFDVTDAVIGAGGAAVLLIAVAGGFTMSRRRRIATAA